MTALDVMMRRLYVYELHTRGITPPEIKLMVAKRYDCHTRTIANDLNTMDKWLPEISKLRLDAEAVTAEVLAKLLIAQRALFNLGETADTSASRVRAYTAAIQSLSLQTDFMFKSGILEKVADKTQLEVKTNKWTFDEILEEYGDVIDEALETLTQKEREKDALRDDRENT